MGPRKGETGVTNVPIAITGMHRSGTSMITRALHDSGLPPGRAPAPTS